MNRSAIRHFCQVAAVLGLLTTILCPWKSFAQTESASIYGRVSDQSGAVIPEAQVRLHNIDTNADITRTTNHEGFYLLPALKPGRYLIVVGKQGFKTVTLKDITLNVQDNVSRNFSLQVGSASESVTVSAESANVNTTDATVSTVVDRNFAENLPMNGRSFQTLIQLTPGVVLTPSSPTDVGQFSINGQRSSSNYWTVDGVSANVGITTFATTGNAAGGAAAGFAVQGGTNSLVSVDALQEFRIQTSTYAPEFGRTPGGQISIVTRSGTNQVHGTAFDYFRNDVLDANDWFADLNKNPKPQERQNDFGGTFSGPIFRDKTFFFFSYEGLRLRLPMVQQTIVPSLAARQNAESVMQPFLSAFPLPNGPAAPGVDQNQFNASFSNKSSLDASSLRIDHAVNSKLMLFGRYNYSPSNLVQRGSMLSNPISSNMTIQTLTAGAAWTPNSVVANDFRFNYSRTTGESSSTVDNFGGAVPVPNSDLPLPSPLATQNAQFSLTIAGAAGFSVGKIQSNTQRQINFVDSVSVQRASHNFKFGADYRRLSPIIDPNLYTQNLVFLDVPSAEAGNFLFGSVGGFEKANLLFQNIGLFGQDTWRIAPRLTLTYGIRWDVDVAPHTTTGPHLASATGVDLSNLANLALAPDGAPIFNTRLGNFAPRVGVAYQLSDKPGRETVLRGGFGIFYDLATQELGSAIAGVYPYATGTFFGGGTFPPSAVDIARPVPSLADLNNEAVQLFDPHLQLPYTRQWNLALEQSLGSQQSVSASYIGSVGRRLIETVGVLQPNSTFLFPELTVNAGTSDYDALQVQFQRRLVHGLQALGSYTWSHSIDTSSSSSSGSSSNIFATQLGPGANRGPSSFDIRQGFSAAVTWNLPAPTTSGIEEMILRDWSLENVFQGRTAPPVDVQYSQLSFNFEPAAVRPDVVPGIPLYLFGPQYPGGKAIDFTPGAVPGGCPDGNPSVGPFCSPPIDPTSGNPIRQGNLGRDSLRGFGAFQWDFAVHRDFPIHERVKMQFRAEFFNVLNHPNFGPPIGDLSNPAAANPQFGLSTQMLGRSLGGSNVGGGGLSSLYQIGGPRSIQFALKLYF